MKLSALFFSAMLWVTPSGQADTTTPSNTKSDGRLSFSAGNLRELVTAAERQISNWPPKKNGETWTMPNVVFGSDARDAWVPIPLDLREVTPLQALTLMAAAAGCVLEPVTAPHETARRVHENSQVIGYRIVPDKARANTTVMLSIMKPSVRTSAAISKIEDEIIRLARERLDQTRLSYEAARVSLSTLDEAECELALAEARSDPLKRAQARLALAEKHLKRLQELHGPGKISEDEFNRARQTKLEAELEVARANPAIPWTEVKENGLKFMPRHLSTEALRGSADTHTGSGSSG